MTKYQLSRPGAPWDYPTLGFTATADGAILDGTLFTPDLEIPPDVYWDVYVGGDPETDITRYALPSVDYLNPIPESAEGSLLTYSRTANQYVQTLPTDAVDPETPFGAALADVIAAGGGISESGDTTGVTDTATIQTALSAARTAGGGVVALKPGTFYVDAALIIASNTTLDARGSTINLVSGSDCNMLRNYADVTPVGTGTVSMSGSSDTVTYANGSVFDSAALGQRVKVPTALAGGQFALVSPVVTNDSGANSLTVAIRSGATATSVTGVLINPDTNITILGGTWDRGATTDGVGLDGMAIRLRHIDGLRVSGLTCLTTGAVGGGSGGSYFITGADLTNYEFSDITFGPRGGSDRDWATSGAGVISDGLHLNGPLRRGVIRDIFGNCGDDMVAVMAADWPTYGDVGGSIVDLDIENIHSVGAWQRHVKLLGGPADIVGGSVPASMLNIHVRGVYGTGGGIWIGDDNRQAGTEQGTMDNITVEKVSVSVANPVFINATNMGRLVLRDIRYKMAGTNSPVVVGTTLSDAPVIEELHIDGLDVTYHSGGSGAALKVESGATITKLIRENWRLNTGATAYDFAGTVSKVLSDTNPAVNQVPRAGNVGRWYTQTPLQGTGSNFLVPTQGKLYLGVPRVEPEDITVSDLAITTNIVGSAGAVARLGIYVIDNQREPYKVTLASAYATLLVDGGTVATDGSTGLKTITLGTAQVIPAGTWYSIATVDQVAGPASRRIFTSAGPFHQVTPFGTGAAFDANGPQLLGQTGVTGALPSSFVPAAYENGTSMSDMGVMFKRSA